MSLVTALLSLFVFNFVLSITNSARILAYYPTPSVSHHLVFRKLANELIRRGHQMTVITTDPEYPKGHTPKNLTEIDVHDISYKIIRERFLATAFKTDDLSSQMESFFIVQIQIIEKQLQATEVKKVIDKNNKYDLLIVEAFQRPPLVLSHIFKIPLIQFSSLGLILDNYKQLGVPEHELFHPTYYRRKLYNLSTWEKYSELYGWYKVANFFHNIEKEEDLMLRRCFGKDVPPLRELANNIDMIFLNSHPMFEGVWPMPPNVIHIYGIHKKPTKLLPTELKKYLDSSKNGVIYISFGSNVQPSMLSPDRMKIFIKVISELPYDVIWKWDTDDMPNKTKNIRLTKWVPQPDLLKHPKVKLFITQGGLQSTDEAIEAGVPLIGIPFLADQWFNVAQSAFHKIALRLNMETWTEDIIRNAINTVLEDSSFRQNVARLRTFMQDQPYTPLERAIWWTEYVLRNNGSRHLRSSAANMPFTEYFEIQYIAPILSVLVISIIIVFVHVLYLGKMTFRNTLKVKIINLGKMIFRKSKVKNN